MNLLKGTAAGGVVRAGDLEAPAGAAVPDGPCVVGVRPESLSLAGAENAHAGLDFQVEVVEPLGGELLAHGSVGGQLAAPDSDADELPLAGRPARARITARLDGRLRLKVGDRVRLAVHPGEIYFFDAQTGAAVR